ncbi:MAG TPA: sulfatase-like hydrolase/transferase [Planctomycetota bacterium]|nr:sulfatase-like hydrolase/transferase [Planctomycetota bacterium]
MFEEAARTPLLVRLPGQKKARRISAPVSQIDLVPTWVSTRLHSPQ